MCCGVRYTVDGELRPVWNCHCERCRRFTGHHMAASAARSADLRLDAEETLAWYEPAYGVFYGFCRRCGASLFWRTDTRPEAISIAAGTLDQPTGLHTEVAVWVAEAADYHVRAGGLDEYARNSSVPD